MSSTLTIYEEDTNLLWGVLVVGTTALATYLLGDAFVDEALFIIGFRQLMSLVLFMIAFIGILKITDPLYRFELSAEGDMLTIETYKGEQPVKNFYYNMREFEELRFAPEDSELNDQALFNFSPTYHLIFKSHITGRFEKLIDLGDISFTLRVPDIARIIQFIRRQHADIRLPEEQEAFLNN
ncbi:hypothetical protein ACG2F4_10680 [Halalkalibaculum sp. DA3122]|uniref:hypothetical protein n=1 Tax=unclassified Halalkalibaculum TaxID=2964617 RepID=UPI0037545ED7